MIFNVKKEQKPVMSVYFNLGKNCLKSDLILLLGRQIYKFINPQTAVTVASPVCVIELKYIRESPKHCNYRNS
jgi:hypothetical protein